MMETFKEIKGTDYGDKMLEKTVAIEAYITDKVYNDLYVNTVIIVGTCFFSWMAARMGGGLMCLGFVFICTASVYRADFRRFNRNLRDDMSRSSAIERLETEPETINWLNSFLAKFWVIYMPALSEQVMTVANEVLKDAAPGFGIDALSLDEFNLGTKAPAVSSIRSYTRIGKDIVEMDWAFAFAPMDTENMTRKEAREKVDPKVALGVRVGKGFVSKSLPILVENMQFRGRMKVRLKFFDNFPHIKLVSVQFLEPPSIDYALKPVGGDTFGLDIMSMIPGLSSFVNNLIHANLRPMLYAPNTFDIDVEELLASQSNDAIGVIAITICEGSDLGKDCNPYANFYVSTNAKDRTTSSVKTESEPSWNETRYLLASTLKQQLCVEVQSFNDKGDDSLVGIATLDLEELLQCEVKKVTAHLEKDGHRKGQVTYEARWFAVTESGVSDDGSKEAPPDAEVGILKLTVHQARRLDNSCSIVGELSPYAEVYFDGTLAKTTRKLKGTNEPGWEESVEMIVTAKTTMSVKILVKDQSSFVEDPVVGELHCSLPKMVAQSIARNEWFDISPRGQIRISAMWKPLSLTGVSPNLNYVAPVGALRVHLLKGFNLLEYESDGAVDPYARIMLNGRACYKTLIHPETLNPLFEEVVYLPITSEAQLVTVDLMDAQHNGRDRPLGSLSFLAGDYMQREKDGSFMAYDGSANVLTGQLQREEKPPKGEVTYTCSFLPVVPVYSLPELEELESKHKEEEQRARAETEHQKKLEQLYKDRPNEFEWYTDEEEEEDERAKHLGPEKQKMSLEQLLEYDSGILGIRLFDADLERADVYLNVLFDDLGYPEFVSKRSDGRKIVSPETSEAFVRNMEHSQFILRVCKKPVAESDGDILAEETFVTKDLLQRGFEHPIDLRVQGNRIKMQFDYLPSSVNLPATEKMADTGVMKLTIMDAVGLKAADKNGKSDPYVKIRLGETTVYKTDKNRRTLDPVWNEQTTFPIPSRSRSHARVEVIDWDIAGDNDSLGGADLDLAALEPMQETEFKVNLDTQGSVRFKGYFVPQYMRPKVDKFASGIPVNLSAVTGVPLKLVGGAANVAGGVGEGVLRGMRHVLGAQKRTHKKYDQIEELDDHNDPSLSFQPVAPTGHIAHDLESLRSKPATVTKEPPSATPNSTLVNSAPNGNGSDIHSLLSRPTPSHARESSDASTFAGSSLGSEILPGRVTVSMLKSALHASLQVKVFLFSGSNRKEIYKTKGTKPSQEGYTWNEAVSFKASTSAKMVFVVKEHHTFGKGREVAVGEVLLQDVVNRTDNVSVDLGDENGELVVNFNYAPRG